MESWMAAVIAAGAAILSSVLTSVLTHFFDQKRISQTQQIQVIDERFQPAIAFLDELISFIDAERTERILTLKHLQDYIKRSPNGKNVWCLSIALDPEDTGLRDLVHSALRYSSIEKGEEELNNYLVMLIKNYETLLLEYGKEKEILLSGRSFKSIINSRKKRITEDEKRFNALLEIVDKFSNNEIRIEQAVGAIKSLKIGINHCVSLIELRKTTINSEKIEKLERRLSSEEEIL
jgi:hypothetical protein